MNRFQGKKILIVGIGKTGFKLITFFNSLECDIRVTDIKPIFDLNKAVKKLKKITPTPQMTFGEHRDEDFLEADVIVYSPAVRYDLPQLELARKEGKEVYSEFGLANMLCNKPIIAVCGSYGRTTVAHMIGFCLKLEGKNVFVGGTDEVAFIDYCMHPGRDEVDFVVVEVSAVQMLGLKAFRPKLVVFSNISEKYDPKHFHSTAEYVETKLSIAKNLTSDDILIVNFDKLRNNNILKNATCQTYWYSRLSFVSQGVVDDVQGTHFHNRRIHSNIFCHSEFKVNQMRIVGVENRENMMAAVSACKAIDISDRSIQMMIERFPGIPHRLEFLLEKNGVLFYNDSKAETMPDLVKSLDAFKAPVILIAGGKDDEEMEYEPFAPPLTEKTRLMVFVGECKERLNRAIGAHNKTYIVGSFEESVLFAYQKSRNGDVILLSPGNPATDFFRDYEERGNYYRKLVYQL